MFTDMRVRSAWNGSGKRSKFPGVFYISLVDCWIRSHSCPSSVSCTGIDQWFSNIPTVSSRGFKSGELEGQEGAAHATGPASRIIFGQQLTYFTTAVWWRTVVLKPHAKARIEDTSSSSPHKCVRRILRQSRALTHASKMWGLWVSVIKLKCIGEKTVVTEGEIEPHKDFNLCSLCMLVVPVFAVNAGSSADCCKICAHVWQAYPVVLTPVTA
jgi:hypothetical protein